MEKKPNELSGNSGQLEKKPMSAEEILETVIERNMQLCVISPGMNKVILEAMEEYHSQFQKSEDVNVIALSIAESVKPELTAKEQALFIAGFQECAKWQSNSEPEKEYDIDFKGYVLCRIKTNGKFNVMMAMDGFGNGIAKSEINIIEVKQLELPEPPKQ